MLPAYWLFLFFGSHLPKLNLGGPPRSDKAAHLVAFEIRPYGISADDDRIEAILRETHGRLLAVPGFEAVAVAWDSPFGDHYLIPIGGPSGLDDAPTNEIVLVGMNIERPPAPPGEGQCRSNMAVWATYYTAVSAGGTVTRTGTGVFKGIVATDPGVIPLGSRMYVPGYGYGVSADTGGGVIGAHIDLAYGANDVYDWGARHVEICLLD